MCPLQSSIYPDPELNTHSWKEGRKQGAVEDTSRSNGVIR